MTKQQVEQLWDEYRDGTISAGDRAAFEAYLRGNDAAASMWKAESQWLSALADAETSFEGEPEAPSAAAFAQGVLSRWSGEPERGEVIGRIGLRRLAGWSIGIAAMVAFFVLGAIYSNVLNVNRANPGANPGGNPGAGTNVVVTPPEQPAAPEADAIGLLMASAKDNYALAAAGPAKIRQGFTSTAAFFDVSRLATLLDPGVPDPAELVEP